jgi:hypothetical protein
VDVQLLLEGGSTNMVSLTTSGVYVPIGKPVLALGAVETGGLVEIPPGMSADMRAMLAYRLLATDDSQSAGGWTDLDTAVAGPAKLMKKGNVSPGTNLMVQLGLKLYMSTGTGVGRASLRYPVLVTT